MSRFSERYGYRQLDDVIQYECMNPDLRMSVYNELFGLLGNYYRSSYLREICRGIWSEHWHLPLDKFPEQYSSRFFEEASKRIAHGEWYEPYDLIEYVANYLKKFDEDDADKLEEMGPEFAYQLSGRGLRTDRLNGFSKELNEMFLRERSGYRLLDGCIAPITSENEMSSVSACVEAPEPFSGARMHMRRAVGHISKKPEPDFNNTVKDAISAVESAARVMVGSEACTLGDALKEMGRLQFAHPALIDGWRKLYGFTSDEGGIRHASNSDEVKVDYALAKYVLVSCSAFVNYLVEEHGSGKGVPS